METGGQRPRRVAKRKRNVAAAEESANPAVEDKTKEAAPEPPPSVDDEDGGPAKRVAKRQKRDSDDPPQEDEAKSMYNPSPLANAEETEATTSRVRRVAKRRKAGVANAQGTTAEASVAIKAAEPPSSAQTATHSETAKISEDTTGLWWEGARKLEEQFAGLDMTLACSRKGPTIFPAVQQGVQTLSQLNFTLRHLAQIKTVYPDAYLLDVRKTHSREKMIYQSCGPLVLTVALPPGAKPTERKAAFHERLIKLKEECNYASTSEFDIPLAPLPDMRPTSVVDAHAQAKTGGKSTKTGLQTAEANGGSMEVVANKPERKKGHEERYEAVLQRIRERQAKLAAEGGVEAQKESSLLRSLPQFNLVLRSLFSVKKYKPIPIEEALSQLCSSYRDSFGLTLSKKDMEQRVKLLIQMLPDLIKTIEGVERVFLVLPKGPIPPDRLNAAIEAKEQERKQHNAAMEE